MDRDSVTYEYPVFWIGALEMLESRLAKTGQPRHLQPMR